MENAAGESNRAKGKMADDPKMIVSDGESLNDYAGITIGRGER